MKKRLLITSIVMMLVVAVALSTATYAWFTSNATVTSDAVTLTAASNNAASLGIGWTATGTFGPSITPESPVAVDDPSTENVDERVFFAPALPNQLTVGITFIDKDSELNTNEIAFKTALATPNNDGDMKFMTPSATTPYNWNDGTNQSFFIKNMSPANAIPSVTLRATIGGDAASLLRVAVFKWSSTDSKYLLLGVLANTASYTYSVVAENTKLTAEDGTYFKKYLGQYVPAVAGTELEVQSGAADYFRDTANSGANATQAPAGKFYTREDLTQAQPTAGVNHAEVAYGTITDGNSVNAMTTAYCVESIQVAQNLAHGATEEFKVLVWEDAVALGDTEQGKTGTVSLTFTAE